MIQESEAVLIIAVPNGFREIGSTPSRHSDASKLAAPARRLIEKGCGLIYEVAQSNSYYGFAEDDPVEFVEMRGQDIPRMVADRQTNIHLGIVGTDRYENSPKKLFDEVEIVRTLGFGTTKLQLGVPEGIPHFSELSKLEDVAGLRVATGLDVLTRRIFRERGVEAEIIEMTGHVETAIRYGRANVIVDLTETGGTMRRNGLFPAECLGTHKAALIGKRNIVDEEISAIKSWFVNRVDKALEHPEIWLESFDTETPSEMKSPAGLAAWVRTVMAYPMLHFMGKSLTSH